MLRPSYFCRSLARLDVSELGIDLPGNGLIVRLACRFIYSKGNTGPSALTMESCKGLKWLLKLVF